jgi:hypothetical protein
MANKGVIYIMTTVVNGLIKIGKTDTKQFNNRMAFLEQNGYYNVNGLQRYYAVEVDEYHKKEKLLHTIFSKSQVAKSELFALDKTQAKEILESFEGKQIFPATGSTITKVSKPKTATKKKSSTAPAPKSQKLTFKLLGIPKGAELEYIYDKNIKATVLDGHSNVEYNGQRYSLSGLVKYLKNGGTWQGGKFFKYKGEILTDLRLKLGV